jgi:hypothetical protein
MIPGRPVAIQGDRPRPSATADVKHYSALSPHRFARHDFWAIALLLTLPLPGTAQQVLPASPGASITLLVQVYSGDRAGHSLRYTIEPAPGVHFLSPSPNAQSGTAGGHFPVQVPLRFIVPVAQPPGPMPVATVRRIWSDGARDSLPVLIHVLDPQAVQADTVVRDAAASVRRPDTTPAPALRRERPEGQEWASIPVGGLTREVEVELYGTARTTAPGGLVTIRWSLNSYEDADQRVRLRLVLPPGWTTQEDDATGREWLLEGWESLEGEIRVTVPRDALPGERHAVRVLGEVVGEPGYAAVYSWVQVTRRGGLRAGQVGLTGTTSLHASNLEAESLEGARYGGVVDLSGRLSRHTTLTLNYRQGPRESTLTNFRIAQEETRWSGNLRRPTWNFQFGNQVLSMGTVLTGPFVRGQGAQLRRTQGLLVGEITALQPASFSTAPAGHVLRGNLALSGARGRLGVAVSDFGRPAGGYSTAPRYPEDIDPEVLERLERERRALAKAARNRVQGAGADAELNLAKVHRFTARAGVLRLSNARGDTVQDVSAEALYAFQHRRATMNLRWRQMPVSLAGIQLPGDEHAADATLRVVGEWRLAGRVYRTRNLTLGNDFHSEGEGASAGVRWFRSGWRLDVSGNVREWSWGETPTEARTVNASFGMPLGPLSLNAFASVGEQRRDTVRAPSASYNGSLRWNGRAGSFSWSASYFETLSAPPRLRTDVLGSLRLGGWELAGGAWATRGLVRGGEPGLWTQLGAPVTPDLQLTLGVEHAPPAWGRPPQWLGTLGVRKKVAFAIPFMRDGGLRVD